MYVLTSPGPLGSLCPASVVQWHEHAYVMIDTAASGELSEVSVALARKNPPPPVMPVRTQPPCMSYFN